jgi:hypothetical protein
MSLTFPTGGEVAVAKNVLNDTGAPITLFQLQLGHGLGDQFVASTPGDGLSFIQALPNRQATMLMSALNTAMAAP